MSLLSRKTGLLLIVVPLALFIYKYHSKAFPELSPRFSLEKSAVVDRADRIAGSLGFAPGKYHQVQTFHENTTDKFFLERQYGVGRLTEDINAGVSIWYWTVRNFIPEQQEEFSIDIDTEGKLVGFQHIIAETTVRPRLSKEEALDKAKQFLKQYVKQHPLEKLALEEVSEKELPGYHRYSFTWKRTDLKWGSGIYHLHVRVDGDQVGWYSEHLKEPEQWHRDFAKQRSVNQIYGLISWSAALLLGIGVLIMFVRMALRDRSLWQRFPVLWAVPVGILLLISSFSGFPELLNSYATNDNFHVFLTNSILSMAFGTLGALCSFFIIGFLADIFWRKTFPEHVSIRSLLTTKGFATRQAMASVPLGFFLAIVSLAYVTAYYLVGSRFHIWVPTSIDYSRVLTSYFPAVEALTVGVRAAWTEEFFFRVLALAFVYRLTGKKWLAILLPATVWGFMHSSYPQMPGYARGVELTIEGIFLGWIAIRYGILTTFLSHCLYNTWLGAIFAWRTGSHFHMAMAALGSIWPVALWILAQIKVRRQGRFLQPGELADGKSVVQQFKEAHALLAAKYRKPCRSVLIGSSLAAAFMLLLLCLQPTRPLADLGSVQLTPGEARHYADAFFTERTGLNAAAYHRTTRYYATMSGAETDYLLKHSNWQSLAKLMRNRLYRQYWYVTYFKAEDRNTFTVTLTPEGRPLLLSRSIGEEEAGAQLDQNAAVALAVDYLQKRLRIPPDRFRMVGYYVTQRPSRRDHSITFEAKDWHIGESKLRWTVSLLGDTVNDFDTDVTVPKDYRRKMSAMGWTDAVNNAISQTTSLLSLIGLVVLLIALLRGRYINWRHSMLLGLVGLFLAAIDQANELCDFFAGYSSTQTMMNFAGSKILEITLVLVMAYFACAFLFAILTGLVRWLTGVNAVQALLGNNFPDARRRFSHGATVALLGWALLWGVGQLSSLLQLTYSDSGMLDWNTFWPSGYSTGLGYLTSALSSSLSSALGSGIVVLLLILVRKKHHWLLFVGLILLVFSDLHIGWQSNLEAAYAISFHVLTTLLEYWILLRLLRFNAYGYLFLYFYQYLLPYAFLLGEKGWPAYRLDSFLIWSALLLPFLLGLCFLATSWLTERGRSQLAPST